VSGAYVSSDVSGDVTSDVSIVLWQPDWRIFEWALQGLAAQEPRPDVHVLVNDDPAGEEADRARHVAASVGLAVRTVRSEPTNRGFAGGHNALLADAFAAGASSVVVLNPDVRLDPSAVGELAAFEPAGRDPWIAGPLLERADAQTLDGAGVVDTAGIRWTRTARHLDEMQGSPLAAAPDHPVQVAGISGACLLVTRSAYDRLVSTTGEFFDEDFVAYREDAELGLRAIQVGVTCWLVPAARGLHVRTLRGTTRGVSARIDSLGVRNRFLIAFKHGTRRPGGHGGALVRDGIVIAGVVLRERSSLRGLREAWALRHVMRAKRRRIRAASVSVPSALP
jgi:GT2 family glycosyltransferase